MKETKKKVKEMLMKKASLRDNDYKLIANIWNKELQQKGYNTFELSTGDFLYMFSNGELTNPESIRRTRQKLQEENTELRGEKYKKRKEDLQNKWKAELGYRVEHSAPSNLAKNWRNES